jgi:hypothetical protein
MGRASLVFHSKRYFEDGAVMELRIWSTPRQVAGSDHWLKYSLYYGESGIRLIGYDNEAGKGDHRHYGDRQEPYVFSGVDSLVADFLQDVRALRGDF